MAEEIKMKLAGEKFSCGHDFTDLTVINFTGPGGSKASAYCCNINLDLDGEPQAYAASRKTNLRPLDNLGDAGLLKSADNAALKARYEAAKQQLSDLEQKKADLIAKAKPASGPTAAPPPPTGPPPVTGKPGAAPAKTAPDPAIVLLDKQIDAKHEELWRIGYENRDENQEKYDPKKKYKDPKNLGKIFWHWYGVVSLRPEDAKRMTMLEMDAPKPTIRRPVLDDKISEYEDVFGRFPVIQSIFEPGTDYYVTQLPHPRNPRFPRWDQRYFLPPEATSQGVFGALSKGLTAQTGLQIKDKVCAVRLDTTDALSFPFRDSGNGNKVAECSMGVFTGLGGIYHPENEGAAKFPNKFLVLYLAFPGGKAPETVLASFATASNAEDFPVMLAFVAQVTADAQARGSKKVGGDPKAAFDTWKKSASTVKPTYVDVIVKGLSTAASTFVERMMKNHATMQGPATFVEGMMQKHGSQVMPGTLTPPGPWPPKK